MNSMYDIIPFAIAKRELKDNGIDSTPASLLFGLIPGMKVPFIQQVILNKSVVKGEIAGKDRATADQKFGDLKTIIAKETDNLTSSHGQVSVSLVAINSIRKEAGLADIL